MLCLQTLECHLKFRDPEEHKWEMGSSVVVLHGKTLTTQYCSNTGIYTVYAQSITLLSLSLFAHIT